jgi:putative NADH-flavin reductase
MVLWNQEKEQASSILARKLIVDADGKSHISVEDYAVAMVDELEKPAHHQERFTIGY